MPQLCYLAPVQARLVIRTRDEHCPPHVHAFSLTQAWEIKVCFSFVHDDPTHLDYLILAGRPMPSHIREVVVEVRERIKQCRRMWWETCGDVCLRNRQVGFASAGKLSLCAVGTGTTVAGGLYFAEQDELECHGKGAVLRGSCP